jgi:hypothetical protein
MQGGRGRAVAPGRDLDLDPGAKGASAATASRLGTCEAGMAFHT